MTLEASPGTVVGDAVVGPGTAVVGFASEAVVVGVAGSVVGVGTVVVGVAGTVVVGGARQSMSSALMR